MADSAHDPAEIVEMFQRAAFGASAWEDALAALASATGSRAGELLGFGSAHAPTFYCNNRLPAEALADFVAARGYDPAVNSRVRIGLQAPELTVLDERHFTTAEDMVKHPAYGAAIRVWGNSFICLTTLLKQDGLSIGLSVLRSEASGNITPAERRLFAEVAPHVRTAVRTYMEFERQGLSLLAGTLEAIGACAFVCDGDARVHAMSPSAEALLASGKWLNLRQGILSAATSAQTRELHDALRAVAAAVPMHAPPPPFVIHNGAGDPLPLEVAPVAAPHELRHRAMAVLIARPPSDLAQRASELSMMLFGLTRREAAVVGQLMLGAGPQKIAERLGVATGTVRVQLRNIFAKAEVQSQVELLAKIAERL